MSGALPAALLARADDRLVLGHRLSEWCGHAPVLEEDLALANVGLDLLGRAQSLYEWVGAREEPPRSPDDLVFFRDATAYRNLLIVELPNGDFAQTILRQFFYDVAERIDLEALAAHDDLDDSLREWVAGARVEGTYHERHSAAWVRRLGDGTAESRARMERALAYLWPYAAEWFEAAPPAPGIDSERAGERWRGEVSSVLDEATLALPEPIEWPKSGGRRGIHTEHLVRLLYEMQSLARAHPGAEW